MKILKTYKKSHLYTEKSRKNREKIATKKFN